MCGSFLSIILAFNLVLIINYADCSGRLWPKGIVHYSINKDHYDAHSQDVITETFANLEKEVCLKFFQLPQSRNGASGEVPGRTLFISNPDKDADCPPTKGFDYSGAIVNMSIGYKCLNPADIARITVLMLRASISREDGLAKGFEYLKAMDNRNTGNMTRLLSDADRNYINSYYNTECSALTSHVDSRAALRQSPDAQMTTEQYYAQKVWPLGIVMYSISPELVNTPSYKILERAMKMIESDSCVTFKSWNEGSSGPKPLGLLRFGTLGDKLDALPWQGYKIGVQDLSLRTLTEGARGHTAHALYMLMHVLGAPMTSNRWDRDNYVQIHWNNVIKRKEYLLEKNNHREAWPANIPYSFESATHAPSNFYCTERCNLGETTVEPKHDFLWQTVSTMGRRTTLHSSDIELLNVMYSQECMNRVAGRGLE